MVAVRTQRNEDMIKAAKTKKKAPAPKKRGRKKAALKVIDLPIGDNIDMKLDISGFRKACDMRVKKLDAEKIKVHPTQGGSMFSLTQCADVIGVDGPQLNYYVKQGTVKPTGRAEAGTKKYFTYDALLTFWIIVKLKEQLGRTVKMKTPKGGDVLAGLQKQLASTV